MQASPEVVDLNTPPSTPKDADGVCVMAQVKDDDVSPAREHSASSGDVDEVQPPKKQRVSGEAAASAAVEDEDDECVVVGSTGVNPNIDLPHTRWNCLKCPRQTTHIGTSCDKCFCVICDIPVAQCDEWAKHCTADPSDSAVMQERALRKKDMRPVFDCTLSQLTQVYPTEVNVELNEISLTSYQRQVVSFMLHTERNGFAVNRLFGAGEIAFHTGGKALRPFIYGGCIALEMGMGKTACVIAACRERRVPTIVVAPQLPCVQWYGQIKRFAPDLAVEMCYCTNQNKIEHRLLRADIVVINATSSLLPSVMARAKRVVIDESHEVLRQSGSPFLATLLSSITVNHIWLVSGTPFGNSERMKDDMFERHLKVLLKFARGTVSNPLIHLPRRFDMWDCLRKDASTDDLKALVMRMEKKQTYQRPDGSSAVVMPMPELEYKTLEVGLSPLERELYNIAACVDGWRAPFKMSGLNSKSSQSISAELERRFYLRQLLLGDRISDFKSAITARLADEFYAADSEAPDVFYSKVDRMTYRIDKCCQALLETSCKIDAVLDQIASLRSHDPKFKAVIVTESDSIGQYVQRKWGARAGVMQRQKGKTSVREQRALIAFQQGQYDVLVCSFAAVKIGTNLDQAGAIYFVDSSIDDTEYKQACARISRCGTQHAKLFATFVYIKETLSEEIYKYHEDRRNGKSFEEAAKRFEDDNPHDFSPPQDFYRPEFTGPFTDMRFSVKQLPSQAWVELFTSDTDINDAFDMICDATRNSEDYEISLRFPPNKRPATYDDFKQIVVSVKDGFTKAFDVPPWTPSSYASAATLTATVNLTDAQAKCFDDISNWHRRSLDGVTIHAVRSSAPDMPYHMWFERWAVIKASCSSCRWCGWRRVHEYEAPFVGMCPTVTHSPDGGTAALVPNGEILNVKSVRGILGTQLEYGDESRLVNASLPQFFPVDTHRASGKMRDYLARSLAMAKTMGNAAYKSTPLHYKQMTTSFFEGRNSVYAKVLVKLDKANINDTISFKYADRRYEAFIREIVPVGLDWFAVAFVVESSPPDKPIVINEHTIVNTKRVIRVGADAFSMKDIVRMVRGDPEKTDKLKEIVMDASIDNAEKLKRASSLV